MALKSLRCTLLLTTQEYDFKGVSLALSDSLGAALSRILEASPYCSICVLPGLELSLASLHLTHKVTLQGSPGTVLKLAEPLTVKTTGNVKLCELTIRPAAGLSGALVHSTADVELSDCSLLGASKAVLAENCCISLISCRVWKGKTELHATSAQMERCSFSEQTAPAVQVTGGRLDLQACVFEGAQAGVVATNCTSVFVEECIFSRLRGTAISIQSSSQVTLRKNRVSACAEDGLVLTNIEGEVLVCGNTVEGLRGSACKLEHIQCTALVEGNSWVHCGNYGLFVLDAAVKIDSCQCYEMQLGGILLAPGGKNVSLHKSVAAGNSEFALCVVLDQTSVLVEGCHLSSNSKDGVRVTGLNGLAGGYLTLLHCKVQRNRGCGLVATDARVVLTDSQVDFNRVANVAGESRELVQGSVDVPTQSCQLL